MGGAANTIAAGKYEILMEALVNSLPQPMMELLGFQPAAAIDGAAWVPAQRDHLLAVHAAL